MRHLVPGTLLTVLLTACGGGASPEPGEPGAADPVVTPSPSSTPTPTPSRAPARAEQLALNRQLIEAAWQGDVGRAGALIRQGADVNWRDETRQSAFLIATSEGPLQLLELTLRHGADVALHDSYDGTGLIRAAERGLWEVVGCLLQTDVETNHVNRLGWTALHEAIVLGEGNQDDVDTVRVLVAGGVDVTIPSRREGRTALEHARSRGQDEVAATLSKALAQLEVADPDAALLRAARAGDPDAVAIALRAGADLETRDEHRRTPLLLAVTHDRLAVARVLVALGASPDALDDRHDTPWLVTGVTGSVAMAELLLRHGPDLTIRNRFGGLSLIPASERGHVDYVRRVVRSGIDVNHVNDLGWTALLEAVILGDGSSRYQEIVRILLDAGADPMIADKDGATAPEHARRRGHSRIAALLG